MSSNSSLRYEELLLLASLFMPDNMLKSKTPRGLRLP